jgi:hypothetical protein
MHFFFSNFTQKCKITGRVYRGMTLRGFVSRTATSQKHTKMPRGLNPVGNWWNIQNMYGLNTYLFYECFRKINQNN